MDLALNNQQRLICHKAQQTKPNKPFGENDKYDFKSVIPCLKIDLMFHPAHRGEFGFFV